ncbi:phage holin family protein [Lacihabitans sp. CS3-21]|uniref:phage holin family protein n=1 Tax=Lacihabitans sp. CS3-21 TaxID=2487332 RepID=UPI0020CD7EE1|nr:phage holin family protein [Lacihabitans sp. CS3-21]
MSIKSSISDYFKIDELKENLIKLIEAKFELKKLEVQEKIEGLISGIVVKVVMAVFLFMGFLFLNILLAIGINYLTNTSYAGYAIFAAVYLILWYIFNTQKAKVEAIIKNKVAEALDEVGV